MNWLVHLNSETNRKILTSHGIPADKLHLLQEGKRDKFLQERRDYLVNLEREFMEKKGLLCLWTLPLNLLRLIRIQNSGYPFIQYYLLNGNITE